MFIYTGSEGYVGYVCSWFKAEEFKQIFCVAQDIFKDLRWLLLVVERFFTSTHLSIIPSKVEQVYKYRLPCDSWQGY